MSSHNSIHTTYSRDECWCCLCWWFSFPPLTSVLAVDECVDWGIMCCSVCWRDLKTSSYFFCPSHSLRAFTFLSSFSHVTKTYGDEAEASVFLSLAKGGKSFPSIFHVSSCERIVTFARSHLVKVARIVEGKNESKVGEKWEMLECFLKKS